MRKILCLGLIVLAAAASTRPGFASVPEGPAKKYLSVEEAVDLGLRHSAGVKASEARVDVAQSKAREVKAGRGPALRFLGSYARLSEVPPFEVTLPMASLLPPGFPRSFIVSPNYYDSFMLRLSILQPLFTGFRLSNGAAAAEALEEAARQELVRDRGDVSFAVRSAYWDYFLTVEWGKAVAENVARLNAHLSDIRNFAGQGLATRNDVLRAEVELANAEVAALEVESARTIASTLLNSLLGLPLDTEVEITSSVEAGPPPAPAFEAGSNNLVRRAKKSRPDLKSMDLKVRASEAAVAAAKGGFYPQIYLAGNTYLANPNPRLLPSQNKFYGTWDIGLTLSFDIWNGGQAAEQTRQAEAQLIQAKEMKRQVEDLITLEVTQGRLAVARAEQRVAAAGRAVSYAQENLRVTQDRFKEGVATSVEVLDAETLLLQAQTARVQARTDLAVARAKLQKALGE